MNEKSNGPCRQTVFAALSGQTVPRHLRVTFCAALLTGLLTHLYMLVNKLPNHDDIGHLFGCSYGAESGRWLLPLVLNASGAFSTPWLNGLLAVCWLAAAACFTVELFRIRRTAFCVLAAAMMVTFPSVTATMTYMFTADGYFFALALACAAAYCAVRFRYGAAFAVPLLVASMAIYQSYFAFAAALCVGALILEALDGEPPKKLLLRCLKLFLTLLGGMLCYLLSVRISAHWVELTGYKGIRELGHVSMRSLPGLIAASYDRYIDFFVRTGMPFHSTLLRAAYPVCAAGSVCLLIQSGLCRRLRPGSWWLLAGLIAAFPLAANVITVMAPGQTPHLLMIYGICLLPVFSLAAAEIRPEVKKQRPASAALSRICAGLAALTVAFGSFSYAVAANQAYLKLDIASKELVSVSARLLSAVEQAEGAYGGIQVVFAGHPSSMLYGDPAPELSAFKMLGVLSVQDYLDAYSYPAYLKAYHAFTGEIHTIESEKTKKLMQRTDVQAMPAYPGDGSVRVIGDCVVVKFRW